MGLESKQALLELSQRIEVVERENFSLNDRQVDLNLVEPAGMDGACGPESRWAIWSGNGRLPFAHDEPNNCP